MKRQSKAKARKTNNLLFVSAFVMATSYLYFVRIHYQLLSTDAPQQWRQLDSKFRAEDNETLDADFEEDTLLAPVFHAGKPPPAETAPCSTWIGRHTQGLLCQKQKRAALEKFVSRNRRGNLDVGKRATTGRFVLPQKSTLQQKTGVKLRRHKHTPFAKQQAILSPKAAAESRARRPGFDEKQREP